MSALEAQHTRELPMELPAPRLSMAAGNHSENTTHDASSDWRVWGRGEEGGTVPSPPPCGENNFLVAWRFAGQRDGVWAAPRGVHLPCDEHQCHNLGTALHPCEPQRIHAGVYYLGGGYYFGQKYSGKIKNFRTETKPANCRFFFIP